jgi:hypothetical protein
MQELMLHSMCVSCWSVTIQQLPHNNHQEGENTIILTKKLNKNRNIHTIIQFKNKRN